MDTADQVVSIVAMKGFDPRSRSELSAPFGLTLAEMVEWSFPGQPVSLFRVVMGGHVIERDVWSKVRPKPKATVVIRPVMQGDNLRSILTVVVTVAAVALGQFYAPALANGIAGGIFSSGFGFGGAVTAGSALTQLTAAAITGGTPVAGTLVQNAIGEGLKCQR